MSEGGAAPGGGGAESSGGGGGGGGGRGRGGGGSRLIMNSDGSFCFEVDLTPGETTIVSWKKMLREHAAEIAAGASSASKPNPVAAGGQFPDLNAPPASSSSGNAVPNPSLDSRIGPALGPVGENAGNEAAQPPSNRLNTVIEKIERLYVKASSDEEDLNDVVPDDDEYDTEDSFIDDSDLNDYFQVDNSAIKHDGYFVNRGKLERLEPSTLPNEQSKKRRRKDLGKGSDGGDNSPNPSKHAKPGKKPRKPAQLVEKNIPGLSTVIALPNIHDEDGKLYNQANSSAVTSRKKHSDSKTREQYSLGVTNGDEMLLGKDSDGKKLGTHTVNSHGSRVKEGPEVFDASNQKLAEKSLYLQIKHDAGNPIYNVSGGIDPSIMQKEKASVYGRPEAGSVADSSSTVRIPHIPKKEGASARARSTSLEKAIKDLEKLVAESRPPSAEIQDADNSSQAIKRRLPQEVKHKLAKVARYAQASHGKITKELVNRLMSIVGHLVQLRTLKRNLKIMVNTGLSAKQEKDSRVQQVKKEVADMVTERIPLMKSKALEQQAGASDDFQEIGAAEKEALKRKYSMDDILEDKICDLYDLYVDGLEEDAGPQVRKLYAELTALWPNGYMDNHGIKRAICRAKDRKKASNSRHKKDPEKMKRKKILARKSEAAREETNSLAQPAYQQQKLVSEPSDHGIILVNKSASSSKSFSGTAVRMPVSLPNADHPAQEQMKGSSSNILDTRASETLKKKKVKRKSEAGPRDADTRVPRLERLFSVQAQGDNNGKPHKGQVTGALPKSNPQPVASSNLQQNLG